MTKEDVNLNRTAENYEVDLLLKNSQLTGIKWRCYLHDTNGYNMCQNNSADIRMTYSVMELPIRY